MWWGALYAQSVSQAVDGFGTSIPVARLTPMPAPAPTASLVVSSSPQLPARSDAENTRASSDAATEEGLREAAVRVISNHYAPALGMADGESNAITLASRVQLLLHGVERSSISTILPSDNSEWETSLRAVPSPSAGHTRVGIVAEGKAGCRPAGATEWTRNGGLRDAVGPFFADRWIEAVVVGTTPATVAATAFLRQTKGCQYVGYFHLPTPGASKPVEYRLQVFMLFSRHEHVNELAEEASFKYLEMEAKNSLLVSGATFTIAPAALIEPGLQSSPLVAPVGWYAVRLDQANYKHKSHPLSGYWLPVSGEAPDASRPWFTPDLLGRMNYGLEYVQRRHLAERAIVPRRADVSSLDRKFTVCRAAVDRRLCMLELLRGKTVYFVGDSHIRIFFYGFLSFLQVNYPLNKVWRGDRSDSIPSHDVTIKFVASYFLDLSKDSAKEMLSESRPHIVITGVGQHHSCHCWTVEKHVDVVAQALETLVGQTRQLNPASPMRHVVWFTVPAQPMNRHLFLPKPVGQGRKDCRNNARHMIYSAYQRATVEHYWAQLGNTSPCVGVDVLDAFALSVGMEHTSFDGAHLYTWVRDAWIDELDLIVQRMLAASGST
jgi:hypothetical protein